MKKPIFFDLDGTLIAGNSWYAFNLYFGMSESEDKVMLDWYSRGIISYDEWDHLIVKILREKNQCTKEKLSDFLKTLKPRPEAISLIQACKDNGYTPIILSGTMRQIAESIKETIGADASYTTSEIVFNEDGSFQTITNEKDEGPAKLRIFEQVCHEYGVSPEDTIHVGDSRNDLEIFEKTCKGILIGEYQKLKPLAWKQIESLKEINSFL